MARDLSARIIMFSMNDDPIFAARAIEVGAKGYVSKTGDPYDLVDAVREVAKAATYLAAGDGPQHRVSRDRRSPRTRFRN